MKYECLIHKNKDNIWRNKLSLQGYNKKYWSNQYCLPGKECKDTPEGKEYRGTLNVTKDGIPCQRWEHDDPHVHVYNTLEENYCRNPDNATAPWCYTMNPDVRWQTCDVTFCFNCKFSYLRCYIVLFHTYSFYTLVIDGRYIVF